MKKLLLLLLLVASPVFADVFLVCDPVTPSTTNADLNPVSYLVTGFGSSPVSVPSTINANGTVQLNYDLTSAGVANGSYTVTAQAVNAKGFAGPASSPFTFVLPVTAPGVPTNLNLSAK